MRFTFRFSSPFVFLLIFLLPACAGAFDILVLPGEAKRTEAVWQMVPTGSEPSLYPLQKVYPGQPWQLLVLGRGFKRNSEGRADVTYSLQLLRPDGSVAEGPVPGLELYRGAVPDVDTLLLSRQHLTLIFGPEDPPGTYEIKVTAVDAVAALEANGSATITLARFADAAPFADEAAFYEWMSNYYRSPDPMRALLAVRQFIQLEPEWQQRGASVLIFLSRVLADSPFLRAQFQETLKVADAADRQKLLLVLAAGREDLTGWVPTLNDQEATFYQDARRRQLPDLNAPPASIQEINALWAQFYATGDIAPLRQLVVGLALHTYKGVQEKIASGELKESADVAAQAAMEEIYKALLRSLLSHSEQQPRVFKYLLFLFETGEESMSAGIRSSLEEVLQIVESQRLEAEANQKLKDKKESVK